MYEKYARWCEREVRWSLTPYLIYAFYQTVPDEAFHYLVNLITDDEFLEVDTSGMAIHVDQDTLNQRIIQLHIMCSIGSAI